jgi:predicted Kef-type K+ transport protein
MLIHVHFLWNHVDILLAAVILVIIVKTIVAASVVKGFGYNNKTSILVRFDNSQYYYFCFFIASYISLTEEP